MNDISDLLIRIHIADCSEHNNLAAEARDYVLATPALIPFFKDFWGRHLNQQGYDLCGTTRFAHSGDYRPTEAGDFMPICLLETTNRLLLENGGRLLLE